MTSGDDRPTPPGGRRRRPKAQAAATSCRQRRRPSTRPCTARHQSDPSSCPTISAPPPVRSEDSHTRTTETMATRTRAAVAPHLGHPLAVGHGHGDRRHAYGGVAAPRDDRRVVDDLAARHSLGVLPERSDVAQVLLRGRRARPCDVNPTRRIDAQAHTATRTLSELHTYTTASVPPLMML
jgi:hypothetical protein